MRSKVVVLLLLALGAAACATAPEPAEPGVPRIQAEALRDRLGEAGLTLVDVRIKGDWLSSDRMIRGAVRGDPNDISSWADTLNREQPIVLYCS